MGVINVLLAVIGSLAWFLLDCYGLALVIFMMLYFSLCFVFTFK